MTVLTRAAVSVLSLVIGSNAEVWAQAGIGIDKIPPNGPVERCTSEVVPKSEPLWFKAETIANEYPTKENKELAGWCNVAERSFSKAIENQMRRGTSNARKACCTFLVNSEGNIQDAFIYSYDDKLSREFALELVKTVGTLPVIPTVPAYLQNSRRLNICVNYPRVELLVDFHDTADDAKFFQRMKANLKINQDVKQHR